MLGIVVSRADDASVAIREQLLDAADWTAVEDSARPEADGGGTVYRTEGAELREFSALHLHLDRPADAFDDPELLVFASRHSGETGPLLTAHHTGNVGPADHGGAPNELARACPNALDRALTALDEHAPPGYETGIECTHHGPTDVGAPSLFVEVGSGPDQWADPDAARAVARAILDLRGVAPDRQPEGATGGRADGDAGPAADADRRHLVGVGGGHYAPRFERVLRETDWAVGHVAADWGLEAVDGSGDLPGVLGEALAESRAAYALVEGDRPGVREAVEAAGGRVVSETWVRETDGLPLPFVRTVESAVAGVEAGLRFGEPAAGYGGGFVVVDLPGEILDEARGIDREATLALFRERTLAFVTDQDGSRPTGPAVLRAAGAYRSLVDGLLDVLRERYDTVEREGGAGGDGAVLVRETAFDPEKARTLGVPEGPAFGRLADGQPVEVDGNSIPPEAVREERERRLPLDGGVIRASDTDESY